MAEYTPMSDTSTALREALVERDILRAGITRMQAESNRAEEKRRGAVEELKVTHSALRSVMESLAARDKEIAGLKAQLPTGRTEADNA